ncbi:MAG: very short patch repair endonuclease [Flavobacteriales bacterium]|nr:very short patch repair endonuclease [Flavobacteriales bacterium]
MLKTKNTYKRDGRAPQPAKEATSKVMSANKAKNTKPELILRKELFKNGIRGYRLHWNKAPGRPDICWPSQKKAIFVNGCYWHRCPKCNLKLPKSNTAWWKAKFDRNIERDQRKIEALEDDGWKVLTIWECEIKEDVDETIEKIQSEFFS